MAGGMYKAQHINFHYRAESRDVFLVLGQCAAADTGIGDDDVRHADTLHEILCCQVQCLRIPHIHGIQGTYTIRIDEA